MIQVVTHHEGSFKDFKLENKKFQALWSYQFIGESYGGSWFLLVQVAEKFSSPAADDINYAKTRSLLIGLGFQKYEKNFKKGLLNDQTLPLLTDRQEIFLFLLDLRSAY